MKEGQDAPEGSVGRGDVAPALEGVPGGDREVWTGQKRSQEETSRVQTDEGIPATSQIESGTHHNAWRTASASTSGRKWSS